MLDSMIVKVFDNDDPVFTSSFAELYKEGDPENFTILVAQKAFEKIRTKPAIRFLAMMRMQQEIVLISANHYISTLPGWFLYHYMISLFSEK